MKPDDPIPAGPYPEGDPALMAAKDSVLLSVIGIVLMAVGFLLAIVFEPALLLLFVGLGLCAYGVWKSVCAVRGRRGIPAKNYLLALTGALLGVLPWLFAVLVFTEPIHYNRQRAKQSRSISNVRQLAVAVMAYSQDYDGRLPGWVRNPDGVFAHNVWDEQVGALIPTKDLFTNGDTGIASPSQPSPRDRVLTYGLNGLLIAPPESRSDPDWERASRHPEPVRLRDLKAPADTILLAELDTNVVGDWRGYATPSVLPFTRSTGKGDSASEAWKSAIGGSGKGGTIDISPRSWVEVAGDGKPENYFDPYTGADGKGVARNLYSGAGNYAFCDGHVQFLRIGMTVGLRLENSDITPERIRSAWAPGNKGNLWVPR